MLGAQGKKAVGVRDFQSFDPAQCETVCWVVRDQRREWEENYNAYTCLSEILAPG